MEEPVNATPRVPEQTSVDSQPSHLCHACVSALTMDELEVDRTYPHHRSLRSFLDAHQMKCYICSHLLHLISEHEHKALQLLAEGKIPEPTHGDSDCNSSDDSSLPSTQRLMGEIEYSWRYHARGGSYVSLTGLVIHIDEGLLEISICLNPAYDEALPAGIRLYEAAPSVWKEVSDSFSYANAPLLITAKGPSGPSTRLRTMQSMTDFSIDMSELGLATTSLPPNTGSLESWSVVEEWIQHCSTQHQCLARRDGWYPTRLVELLPSDRFRVVRSDSASFCRGERYITLSHKWGNGNFLRLDTSNLSDLEKGLPINGLRKTFQDTLTVAQRLGIPYVWIDSLCIVQSGDNHEDWRRESQTMTEVYSNSFCNISADYGDEGNGLFYQRRNEDFEPFEPPCKMQVRWKEWSRKSSPEVRELSSGAQISPSGSTTSYIVRRTKWREDLAESPLNRRGWVMQERLLAPRVLSFTPRMVSWHCGKMDTTEIWPRRSFGNAFLVDFLWDLDQSNQSHSLSQRGFQFHSQRHWGEQDVGPLIDWFYRLLDDYTGCELTKESDRLVAIAGVARKLRPIVRDQYVAGLWANSLPWALSWRANSYERRQPAASYYSPTFSWAACAGQVAMFRDSPPSGEVTLLSAAAFIKYRSSRLSPTAVQQSDVEILTDDVFGPLRSPTAEVQVRGILRSCRSASRETDVGLEFTAYPSTSTEACWTRPRASENRSGIDVHMDHEIDPGESAHSILYYAVILLDQRYDASGSYKADGLLLESVDASLGRFKRVGHILQPYKIGDKPELLRPLGNERDLPAWSFDENTGEHTFYIE